MRCLKIILVLVAISCIICCLNGCSKQGLREENNLYYFYSEYGVLKKINLHTNRTTLACDDPLCSHDFDCKFSNAHSPTLIGTVLYFYRDADVFLENDVPYMTTHICGYDYVSGKYTVFEEITHGNQENVCGKFQIYNGFIYYYQQVLVGEEIEFSLRRINVETKQKEEFDWHHTIWHFAIYNDRLYFSDAVDGIYSTDLYNNNRVNIVQPEKNALIYARKIDEKGNVYYIVTSENEDTLYKYDVDSNQVRRIDSADSIVYVHIIGDIVYYLKGVETETNYVLNEPFVYKWIDGSSDVVYVSNDNLISLMSCGAHLIIEKDDGELVIVDTTG